MKRILVLAALVLLISIPVAAVQLDYQNAEDFADLTNCTISASGGTCAWGTSAVGGNQHVDVVSPGKFGNSYAMYGTASPMTYAAGTIVGGAWTPSFGQGSIRLYDGSKSTLATFGLGTTLTANDRYEIRVNSGIATLYKNGISQSSSGALAQNPSYIGFGASSLNVVTAGVSYWDDLVYGSSEDTTVLDMPESGMYYIKKDFVNPASSGFYNASNYLINSNNMPMSFSRSNLSGQCLINESIYLINAQTGTVYETQYTGTACSGSRSFDFGSSLVAANAPYGWYQTKLNNTLSDRIAYIANGANIAFDANDYSIGDLTTITYLVDSGYWLQGEYTYRIDIVDAYGTVHDTQNIATSSGTVTYTWNSDTDTQGVYFAEVIADRISDGEDILLNYDYATLTAAFGFNGYVNAAGTAQPISAANVTYAQGSTISNSSSGFDGNYSVSGFLTGIAIWANVSATGYETQNFTFTVQNGHTITRNITLNSTSPVFTGLAIGGVARDGVLIGQTITNGYGRPISGATCYLKNTTNSEIYSNLTNNAGWYLFDESISVFLTLDRPYDLWCQRTGYGNSPNYTVVA